MRTTVTLDEDVVRLLEQARARGRTSFKQALNDAVRRGLGRGEPEQEDPFVVKARELGLRSGLDPAGMRELDDDLEVDEFLRRTRRLERALS